MVLNSNTKDDKISICKIMFSHIFHRQRHKLLRKLSRESRCASSGSVVYQCSCRRLPRFSSTIGEYKQRIVKKTRCKLSRNHVVQHMDRHLARKLNVARHDGQMRSLTRATRQGREYTSSNSSLEAMVWHKFQPDFSQSSSGLKAPGARQTWG